jgi:hypothetical protein
MNRQHFTGFLIRMWIFAALRPVWFGTSGGHCQAGRKADTESKRRKDIMDDSVSGGNDGRRGRPDPERTEQRSGWWPHQNDGRRRMPLT